MFEEEKTKKLGNSQSIEQSSFTWNINNILTLNNDDEIQSDAFEAGGHKWRIIFGKGKRKRDFIIYLEPADLETLPNNDWTRKAKFKLSLIINEVKGQTIVLEAKHTFNDSEYYWGFAFEMPFSRAHMDGEELDIPCIIFRAEVWCGEEQDKGEPEYLNQKANLNLEQITSSPAEFDTLFTNIRTILEVKTSEADNSCKFTEKEIGNAQKISKQCLLMDLGSFLRSGKAFELKNSLSIMLATNSFPSPNMVDKITKFVAEFDELIEKYEAAQQDLSEARENDDLVGEIKATLKQLSSKFVPLRNQAEAVHRETERLESVLAERKATKARVKKRLEDLAGQATASKQALLCAEQNMKMSLIKKEQAEKIIGHFESSWDSLKDLNSS